MRLATRPMCCGARQTAVLSVITYKTSAKAFLPLAQCLVPWQNEETCLRLGASAVVRTERRTGNVEPTYDTVKGVGK